MTKKKTVPKITYKQLWDENVLLKERLESLEKQVAYLREEANKRLADREPGASQDEAMATHETINGMAAGRPGTHQGRRYATPAGPNFPDDIYPPGCGPMQLMWSTNRRGEIVIGVQGDSFHHFEDRLAAVSWLMGVAQRIINDKIPER